MLARAAFAGGLMAATMVVGLLGQQAGTPVDMATAPRAVAAAVLRADAAITDMQGTLIGRLNTAMTSGGPAAAIQVCRTDAQQLTRTVGETHHVQLGRTSHRLRNPANEPRPWSASLVAAGAGRKVADASPVVVDLGDRVGVLRPIGTQPLCVACHGPRETIDPSVREVLAVAYPQDEAVGFAAGDLRGWVWAEVLK